MDMDINENVLIDNNLKQKVTNADIIYNQLKKDIIYLYYKPGEKLSEVKIASRYGVSRDPVRKSFSRLAQEGMLESKPQVGTIVKPISSKQGSDVCDIRLLLETYAITTAISNIEESVIDELLTEYDLISKRLIIQDDVEIKNEIYNLDDKMHQVIYDASGNSMIKEVVKSFSYIIKRIQIFNMSYHQRKLATMDEMYSILIAIKERNVTKGIEAMRKHITNIKRTVENI